MLDAGYAGTSTVQYYFGRYSCYVKKTGKNESKVITVSAREIVRSWELLVIRFAGTIHLNPNLNGT